MVHALERGSVYAHVARELRVESITRHVDSKLLSDQREQTSLYLKVRPLVIAFDGRWRPRGEMPRHIAERRRGSARRRAHLPVPGNGAHARAPRRSPHARHTSRWVMPGSTDASGVDGAIADRDKSVIDTTLRRTQ